MACQHFQAQKVQERTRQELLARKKRGELQEEVSLHLDHAQYVLTLLMFLGPICFRVDMLKAHRRRITG